MNTKTTTKYVGMDVHKSTMSIAVLDADGKLVMQSVIETRKAAILEFLEGLRGTVHVTFEEGNYSAWLYPLLRPLVARVIVCNPRKNALLKSGNKSDQIDAHKLAELLWMNRLSHVYHVDHGLETLKELWRVYATLTQDSTRVMSRLKAVYRGQAIPVKGRTLYTRRRRNQWLEQLPPQRPGLRYRVERLFEELDGLQKLRRQARAELLRESRKQPASQILPSIPFLGPIRTALLIARVQTPHRFRSKRQFWNYCGLGLETRSSADYGVVQGGLQRRKKPAFIRGLNFDHNHELKSIFKSTATTASARPGPFHEFYEALLAKHMEPEMARLTLARKIAVIVLTLWKKGARFDPQYLKTQAA